MGSFIFKIILYQKHYFVGNLSSIVRLKKYVYSILNFLMFKTIEWNKDKMVEVKYKKISQS